jgi:hypothetical protein
MVFVPESGAARAREEVRRMRDERRTRIGDQKGRREGFIAVGT